MVGTWQVIQVHQQRKNVHEEVTIRIGKGDVQDKEWDNLESFP